MSSTNSVDGWWSSGGTRRDGGARRPRELHAAKKLTASFCPWCSSHGSPPVQRAWGARQPSPEDGFSFAASLVQRGVAARLWQAWSKCTQVRKTQ